VSKLASCFPALLRECLEALLSVVESTPADGASEVR
jgi:hypothetical protein